MNSPYLTSIKSVKKLAETTKLHNQFVVVAKLFPTPRTSRGNISELIVQGIAPIPIAYESK